MDMKRLNSGYGGYLPTQSGSDEHLQTRSDTFYGKLGSISRESDNGTFPTRRISFAQTYSPRRIRVQLSYDEDAYPGGIDIDIFALLYDTSCTFVDCIFYKHPEDASGSFSLNQKTNCLTIDLERVPDACHTVVLAAAVYTTGMSLTELEGGLIEIAEGFMGPVLFSIPLQSVECSSDSSSNTAGLLFFCLSEFGGKWRCRRLQKFCKPELPSLMKMAKEEAQQIEDDFEMGNLTRLRTLDYAARTTDISASSSSDRRREKSKGTISINSSKLEKLRNRISSLGGIDSPEGEGTEERLAAVEKEQKRMMRRLMEVEGKLDMILDALKG